jgi:parallel beta-helix repeat protein/predicted outer membrane repeat protein
LWRWTNMRSLSVILLAVFGSLLLLGCEPGKPRPINILTVESEYGSPTPPVGRYYVKWGLTITASVDSSVPAGGGTCYACVGWTGTGSAPPGGSTNSVTFTITENSSITWLWKTQYELTVEILPEGSGTVELSPAGEDGYYDDGAVVTLTANPNTGYVFAHWSGDLSGTDNPATLIMVGHKSVIANFVPAIYVDGASGQDTNDGLTWETAVKTIQKGLDLAPATGWTVLVADGTYTGAGNKDLDFNGKAIHLKSVGGAENCIIDCENSGRGFYFHSGETANSVVEGFTIRNGAFGAGGAVCCDHSSPTIINCTISGNSAYLGGALFCGGSSPSGSSSPTITNCTFSGNSAEENGGAVFCSYSSSPTITNCTFSGNSASSGGAVGCIDYSSPTITNCTFSGNSASSGGAVYCDSSSPTITNSIMWSNSAALGNEIYVYNSLASVTLSNSDVTSGGYGGITGNITENSCIHLDPLFFDAGNGNYHLQAGSPCIDAGDSSLVPEGITTDLDGNPRILDGNSDGTATVDIGAYEYQP